MTDRLESIRAERGDRLRITEIFFSLQGESRHQGLPCVFVRLTGCNLRCSWCDTEYAFFGGKSTSLDDIEAKIAEYPSKRVEITGGEPLLQAATPKLAARLLAKGYTVLCETSGERDIGVLPAGVKRIVDVKAPGSGEAEQNRWANFEVLTPEDEVKFVIADRADFDYALDVVKRYGLDGRITLLLSPVHGKLAPKDLAEWILASGVDARLNLQLHKILWGDAPGH